MTFSNSKPTIEDATFYLQQLDLSYIIDAMCAASYPLPRWTVADATHCATLYKNFLLLFKLCPNSKLVPTRYIDEFWHNHILYTKNYHHDCAHIFGHYLHHEPATPGEDAKRLIDDFLKTKQLYLDFFHHAMDVL